MLPRNNPDRIRIVFDDRRLLANAGLLLSATFAQHLGLGELIDHHTGLGGAPGRANTAVQDDGGRPVEVLQAAGVLVTRSNLDPGLAYVGLTAEIHLPKQGTIWPAGRRGLVWANGP